MNTTDRFRVLGWGLLSVTVGAALVGWFVGRDPSSLAWIVAVPGLGEASNIGKRATYKKEAVE